MTSPIQKRYYFIDEIRGITLLSMILYHAVWDLVYIFHQDWEWFRSDIGYVWQQSICWIFIFVSGFCWSFGKRKWKRGIKVFLAGTLITMITLFFMPENQVIFGVLTLLSSCTVFMIPLEKLLGKCKTNIGFLISFLLFLIFRNVNRGYLGFEKWNLVKLPEILYQNLFTSYLGFPYPEFFSTDYFSIIPWLFLFITGYFFYRILEEKNLLKQITIKNIYPVEWLGRHSLEIYLFHQPILFMGLRLCFS